MNVLRSHRCMRPGSWLAAGLSAGMSALLLLSACSSETPLRARTFEFQGQVVFPAFPQGGELYRVWVPLPGNGPAQEIRDLKVVSPVGYETREEKIFGNRYAYIEFDAESYPGPLSVTFGFQVTRRERKVDFDRDSLAGVPVAYAAPHLKRFLEPNRLVPLGGIIGDLSKKLAGGVEDPLAKARKIYDFVVSTMAYDKNGDGWGRGDAIYACNVKKGNCTDFHSLFIGVARAAGIPARFEIGFSLPAGEPRGYISGYHCWAQFYVEGVGWIPVDASEAWRNPTRKDYFFGALDEHRVQFTVGRDIRLDSEHTGEPLNYFIYPYAEVDGQPVEPTEKRFWFRDLPQ